jgi:hypothetical protein
MELQRSKLSRSCSSIGHVLAERVEEILRVRSNCAPQAIEVIAAAYSGKSAPPQPAIRRHQSRVMQSGREVAPDDWLTIVSRGLARNEG